MAIGIENYPNVDTSDPVNYPNGIVKDGAPGVPPTPVNKFTNGDMHMFFDKLLRLAGLVASGDPENETNGYQLIDALIAKIEQQVIGTKRVYSAGAGQAWNLRRFTVVASMPIVTLASTKQELTLGGSNVYEFELPSSPAYEVVTFGTDINPGYVAYFYWLPATGGFDIILNSTNTSGKPMIVKEGASGSNVAFTPIIGRTYMVIRRTSVWEIVG